MDVSNKNSDQNTCNDNNALQLIKEITVLFLRIFMAIIYSIYRKIIPVAEKSVQGEIVLITGAGHGIGRELALQYAALDALVVCLDINAQTNKKTVDEIKNKGKSAFGYTCDVTKRSEVIKTVAKIQNEVGDITILINNAGIFMTHSLLDHTEEEIRRMIEINTMSHFWTLQSVLPSMIKNNYGHIIALSSMLGLSGMRYLVPYCSSKYAVRGIMDALRHELRFDPKNNINCTTVYPSIINTGFSKTHVVRFPKYFKEISPVTAAQIIISAQRQGLIEVTIPKNILAAHYTLKNLPVQATDLISNFVNVYFESDK